MKLIQRYLFREFLPVCLVALLFFVLMLELGDLFANLWKYLTNEVAVKDIVRAMLLYVPKCVSYAMPLSVLFGSAYTMGTFYARNELTSVFASGYPLSSLVFPLIVFGFILSGAMFFFEDRIVIHSSAERKALVKVLLKEEDSLSNSNIVVRSDNGQYVYSADYYQDKDMKLFSLYVAIRDPEGNILSVVQAPSATWVAPTWVLDDPRVYSYGVDGEVTLTQNLRGIELTEDPSSFRKNATSVDELGSRDAKQFIERIRRSGQPYAEEQANYYKRFSFPFTIFIVLFFSISLGGRFKKNVILMSLLISLSIAVGYYVTQMVSMLFAKWEYVTPLAGAWFPVILFSALSALLLKYART